MKAAIVGLEGPELREEEAALLRAFSPAGIILFARNIQGAEPLTRLTQEIRRALPERAVLMVDQEGGRVARLRPPDWLAHPTAETIGQLDRRDEVAGSRLAWLTGALIGLDCAAAGFDVVCAPVLDVRAEGATDAIGDRSFGAEPGRVAALGQAMADGLMDAGVQPVGKHAPGHGQARVDSHITLPWIGREADLSGDFQVFRALRGLPWMMTAHIVFEGLDDAGPATLSPVVIDQVIRGTIGFDGVLVSDDLAMGALSGPPGERAASALGAGCDLALHCSGRFEETEAVLTRVGDASPDTLRRMARGREMVERRRVPLDRATLLAERAGLGA